MKKILKTLPFAVVIILISVFFIYTADYYRADTSAEKALASGGGVTVEKADYGFFFDGPGDDCALIFYPGGKVEETAYAPLLNRLAQNGVDAFLVKMPFRLAFFGMNKAQEIIDSYDYSRFYIGGHSLGGVACASFAAKNPDLVDGVILLAAYPAEKLADSTGAVLVYGSEDGVLNMEKYEKSKSLLPASFREYVIEGGNHAFFGSYGNQDGDGEAKITPAQQTEKTVEIIVNSMKGKEDK
ncbi:MAG: alpha/beta hydrolase [Clostridia bacterium]|nr:alpha/beta hydrolase [Clostridia bacterium]